MMDTKKFMRKVGFLEKILSLKRNAVSGFGLGVGILILVFSLIFLNNSLNASFFNPILFQGSNGMSINSSSSSPSLELHMGEEQRVAELMERSKSEIFLSPKSGNFVSEKTHEGNLSEKDKDSSFLVPNGGKSVTEETHEEKKVKSGSFHSEEGIVGVKIHQGNLSVEVNCSSFSKKDEAISVKTDGGNLSENSKNSSFSVSNGGKTVTEETHEEDFKSKEEKHGSFHSKEGKVGEEMHQGNLSGKVNNVISEKTHEANSVEIRTENLPEKDKVAFSSIDFRDMNRIGNHSMKCDIFDGRWVRDDEGPYYYPAGSCPHIDRDFDCHLNGRRDDVFLRWRWQPNECHIPSLNATDFLERMRGKRLLLVGDSLNRNMWESLVCILRHSVVNKSKVYEITGRKDFKRKGSYSFRFEDYNYSIDFISAPFLVKPSHFHGRNGSMETLRLDLMDQSSTLYRDSDVIVFNSGHWWTHDKTSKGENYYQEGNHVYPKLEAIKAYKKALTTWAKWIDKNIDLNRTQVFFRGYSLTHFRGGQWNSGGQCHKETEPIFNESYLEEYPSKMKVLERVLQKMKTPVVYLNISKLTDYRKDAHPSIYRKKYKTVEEQIAAETSQDCSHWCLPGVPDTWNELLYASLLMAGIGSWRN